MTTKIVTDIDREAKEWAQSEPLKSMHNTETLVWVRIQAYIAGYLRGLDRTVININKLTRGEKIEIATCIMGSLPFNDREDIFKRAEVADAQLIASFKRLRIQIEEQVQLDRDFHDGKFDIE